MSGTFFQPSGDANWDRGLGTLAQGLFPDPSNIARAGYYGAEQRKAQLQAAQAREGIAAGHQILARGPGSGLAQAPLQFTPDPASGTMVLQDTVGQQQPSLGQTVAGGGQATPAIPPPEVLANIIAPGNEPNAKGLGATGTPPPASSPSPGAPPAPNTTTSNGQVPTNNQGDGPLHMNSVTAPDGGQKYAGPAAPNGSPAPPQFDLATYTALMGMTGRNPELAKMGILGYIRDAEQRGTLPVGTAKNIADRADQLTADLGSTVFGTKTQADTGRYQSDQTLRGTLGSAQIQANAGITQEQLRQTGAGQRTEAEQTGQTTRTSMVEAGALQRQQAQDAAAQQRLDGAMVETYNKDGTISVATFKEAREQHLPMTAKSVDQMHALALQLGIGGQPQAARDVGAATQAMQPSQAMTVQEQIGAENHLNVRVPQLFAPTEGFQRELPVQLDPHEQADVLTRAQEIYAHTDRSSAAYHNHTVAVDQAINELQATGHMPKQADMQSMFDVAGKYLGHDERIKQQVNPGGKTQSRYVVPQLKPYEPGAISIAPSNLKEGDPVRAGNMTGVVHNGFVYPR